MSQLLGWENRLGYLSENKVFVEDLDAFLKFAKKKYPKYKNLEGKNVNLRCYTYRGQNFVYISVSVKTQGYNQIWLERPKETDGLIKELTDFNNMLKIAGKKSSYVKK